MKVNTKQMISAALFAALVLVLTFFIKVPLPNGYANLGDCAVLLAGWLLGPIYGLASAAIGSMLADIFSGYAMYAAATFIIKGLMALVAYALYQKLKKHANRILSLIISGAFAELLMVFGYFVFEDVLYGAGMALLNIPFNAIQGAVGLIVALFFMGAFKKTNKK
ncbi:MAG: ECF transporter S component [Clostridia bacterium]|nr:ECF transporter S component [Clostridia bacterium]MBQ3553951.1 ECF transporter S component [Clostridia bacterium]